jgi:pimeloyl-ACP methyl ester carboxylesterase
MPFFELKDGFKVAYEEHGPKDGSSGRDATFDRSHRKVSLPGPAVIFLHSFLMNRAMFSPQVDKLKSTYRCILVDERGHGETRAGPNEAKSFTFWDTANDVLALSHGLGLKLISIVGISQGGFVAMRCAMLEPDFVKSIAVMGTSADAESEENKVAFGGIWKAWDENVGGLETSLRDLAGRLAAPRANSSFRGGRGRVELCLQTPNTHRD